MRVPSVLPLLLAAILTGPAAAAPAAGAAPQSRGSGRAPAAGQRPVPRPAEQVVVVETTEGRIAIRLYPADAPQTVANFTKLVRAGFYDSLTFHRVVPGFVLQGGDPNSRDENPFNDGEGGPGWTVPAEIKRTHGKGAVAMARLPDVVNPKRESNGSQFYIALRALPNLDGAYTVFGQVIAGWDAIDRLVALAGRQDIARVGENANPGRLALIRHTRLEPLSRWNARRPAAASDSSRH